MAQRSAITRGDLNQRDPEPGPERAAGMGKDAELAETDGGGDGAPGAGRGGVEGIGAESAVREKSGRGDDAATVWDAEYSRRGIGSVRTAVGAEAEGRSGPP